MPGLAVDGHSVAAAAGDVVHDGCIGVQLLALLIEIGGQQIRAALDLAQRRLQLSDQKLDQRGLAAAVGADDADAISALYAG